MSTRTWLDDVRASGVPYHVRTSWMDGASADGALSRFLTLDNPQEVYIGATSHGGVYGSDPFTPADAPTDPPLADQYGLLLAFFQRHLATGAAAAPPVKQLHYLTMGEGVWRSTDTWPPAGGVAQRLYLADAGALTPVRPGRTGDTAIVTDASANTGRIARWDTVGNGGLRVRVDRSATSALTRFVSAPFTSDLRITGHLQMQLELSSARTDGTLIAYLEAIAPNGAITYITEGNLRLIHRKVAASEPAGRPLRIPCSFARADAMPLTPGERFTLRLDLLPTSVRIQAGHRLALCLVDRDITHFDDYAGTEAPTLTIHTGAREGSWLDFLAY